MYALLHLLKSTTVKMRSGSHAVMLASIVAAVTLLSSGAGPASANSVGCTLAEGSNASYVCLTIRGSGLRVDGFRVTRNHPKNSICGYQAWVWVGQPTRGAVNYYSPFRSGCSWNTAWMDMYPRRTFEHNSKACGHWYESGRWISGVPCNRILR
jgi:hypothetical protein